MATRFQRPLKVVVSIAIGNRKQRFELKKQEQDHRIDVAVLSDIHLKHLSVTLQYKLPILSDRSIYELKRRNCRCC
jgi:hypothetical protein